MVFCMIFIGYMKEFEIFDDLLTIMEYLKESMNSTAVK